VTRMVSKALACIFKMTERKCFHSGAGSRFQRSFVEAKSNLLDSRLGSR
jgi:hypothetical protein